ncbi:MAG: DUF4396 domain-containing protein [Saprospiraceae bacterium]
MNTIQLKTNLHCDACVAKLQPLLDQDTRIHHWKTAQQASDTWVEIHGNLDETEARQLVEAAGFNIHTSTVQADAHHHHHTAHTQEPRRFWADVSIWRRSAFNTFNCLLGCSIGDFGMLIFLQYYYPETPMLIQMILAIIAGWATSVLWETTLLRWNEKLSWKVAFQMALSMSFLSIVAMELVMNTTDFMITGGQMDFSNPAYWLAFLPAALAGFLAPLPYNYYQLKKYNKSHH